MISVGQALPINLLTETAIKRLQCAHSKRRTPLNLRRQQIIHTGTVLYNVIKDTLNY